jgi:outer membrane protein OmpU
MGIKSTDSVSTFSSRVRMTLTGSGTTDGGLAFGGSFGVHDNQGANAGSAGSTFISGAFGKISMGDVASGDSAAVGQLGSVGYTGLGSTNSINYAADGFDGFGLTGDLAVAGSWSAYNATYNAGAPAKDNVDDAGGAKVLYTYAANGLSLNVSSAQLTDGGASAYGVGAAYTTGALTVALGYGKTDITLNDIKTYVADDNGTATGAAAAAFQLDGFAGDVTDTSVSATYVMGATSVKAIYQQKELDVTRAATVATTAIGAVAANTHTLSATSMGLSVAHKIDALTLKAFTVSTTLDTTLSTTDATVSRSGIGASYNLGGGATFDAGYVQVDTPALTGGSYASGTEITRGALSTTSYNAFDVGVNFSF